ncbi:MAG: PqqD family protein [Xanthomonadales bacterium]|nr:PqqD family protein [Xanthomonadales bacterium]
MSQVDLSTRIRIAEDVLVQAVGGELVMLDLNQEKYFGLDPVGARIWALIQDHGSLEQVYRAMLDEYDVEAEQLESDLLELVNDLLDAGVIETAD